MIIKKGTSTLWVEPWGENSLRVRMTNDPTMDENDWALTEKLAETNATLTLETIDVTDPWYKPEAYAKYHQTGTKATLVNGKITAKVSTEGWISFYNQEEELLTEEYWRNRERMNRFCVPLGVSAREMEPILGTTDYKLTARFEAFDDEKIFGMGQYQESHMDKKGAVLELAHRNSQASVPFYVSSRGYGFFWNNPAIGTVTFGTNKTEWVANSTKKLDYFITAGDTPAEIISQYTMATGRSPMMPEYGLGYWQCKLRYRNQEEILAVAREHKRRGLPMDAIVVDFFHWTMQGDFKFEPREWPDPEAMVKELKELGIETVVSVWPTVDERSENYGAMADQGFLVRNDRGVQSHMTWMGNTVFYDATNPGAQKFVWDKCKENYYDKGIRCFWLDEAEPEYTVYDFENYRYHLGPDIQVGNIYPVMYAKTFFDGMQKEGQENIINLLRCAWAGSQRYGALVWSGDIKSSFPSMKNQLAAGLNMGIAGIPWWTTDIGGFFGAHAEDPDFHELLIRWFEYGTFCPVMRLHGYRWPLQPQQGTTGGATCVSGAPNEVWSFTDQVCDILSEYILLRERMRPYITKLMQQAHEKGTPVMRPLFYDFPEDQECWNVETQYMFGPDVLVTPVTEKDCRKVTVYLPAGAKWTNAWTKESYEGGQRIEVDAPIEQIPLFTRNEFVLDV